MHKFAVAEIEAMDLEMFEALMDSAHEEPFIITSENNEDVVVVPVSQITGLVDKLIDAVDKPQ